MMKMTKVREVSTFLFAVLLHLCNAEAKDAYQKSESTRTEWIVDASCPAG